MNTTPDTKVSVAQRMLTGAGGLDFVGRRKTWYSITAVVIVVCFAAIILRGFSLGIDFSGGTKINMPAGGINPSSVSQTF